MPGIVSEILAADVGRLGFCLVLRGGIPGVRLANDARGGVSLGWTATGRCRGVLQRTR